MQVKVRNYKLVSISYDPQTGQHDYKKDYGDGRSIYIYFDEDTYITDVENFSKALEEMLKKHTGKSMCNQTYKELEKKYMDLLQLYRNFGSLYTQKEWDRISCFRSGSPYIVFNADNFFEKY